MNEIKMKALKAFQQHQLIITHQSEFILHQTQTQPYVTHKKGKGQR